jgi:glycerol uptake facilitator-like aquaporin
VARVVGAGHMVTDVGAGQALGLLMSGLSVGFMSVVIIAISQSVSGARLNPAASLVMALCTQFSPGNALMCAVLRSLGPLSVP